MRWPERTDKERFFEKVEQPASGAACWIWNASRCSGGYGTFWFDRRTQPAHRVAYMLFRGEIPEGLDVLHKCDNPRCVNPEHFFLGTDIENARDKSRKGRHYLQRRTHCARAGHPLSGDNLYVTKIGGRSCRACQREHGRVYDRTQRRRPKVA